MKFNIILSLVLFTIFSFDKACGLTCYSCTGCSPSTNGNSITCTGSETNCYVGQKSDSTVDQGCTANLGTIINSYSSSKSCASNLCNSNSYTSLSGASVTVTYTKNNAFTNRFSFNIFLFVFIAYLIF